MQCIILFDKLDHTLLRAFYKTAGNTFNATIAITMTQGPHILVHCIAVDIWFLLTIF